MTMTMAKNNANEKLQELAGQFFNEVIRCVKSGEVTPTYHSEIGGERFGLEIKGVDDSNLTIFLHRNGNVYISMSNDFQLFDEKAAKAVWRECKEKYVAYKADEYKKELAEALELDE